jgi:hypothetical protein
MRPHTAPPGEAWRLRQGPFVFSGSPPILNGEIEIENTSDEPVRVRLIPIGRKPSRAKAGPPPLGDVRLSVRIAPNERVRAPAQMFIEPGTPAGTYEVTLEVGKQREPALVHVFTNRLVEIRPRPIQLAGRAGESLSHAAVAISRGNVPYRIPTGLSVFLEERDWIGRALVFALRETTTKDTHQQFLDRGLQEFRSSLPSPARVKVTKPKPDLEPGETLAMVIGITLPAGLVKGRTYFGSTPFMGGRLSFDIECTGATSSRGRSAR